MIDFLLPGTKFKPRTFEVILADISESDKITRLSMLFNIFPIIKSIAFLGES